MSIFGSNEKEETNTTFLFDTDKDTINQSNLAKDIKIHGSLEAKDYIEFSGNINGTIKSSTVNIRQAGFVKGTVSGDSVTIEGEIDGDIQAKDLYKIYCKKIKGTIRYTNIDIQNGSIINADLFYSS